MESPAHSPRNCANRSIRAPSRSLARPSLRIQKPDFALQLGFYLCCQRPKRENVVPGSDHAQGGKRTRLHAPNRTFSKPSCGHLASKMFSAGMISVQFSSVAQSCPSLCDPMDCSLPGFTDHGIFQGGVLEWVAFSFSRGSSQPRDRTQVSHIVGRRFTL